VVFGNWRGVWGAPGITPAQRDELVKKIHSATETRSGRTCSPRWVVALYLSGDAYARFVDDEIEAAGVAGGLAGLRK
jgi:putative tricarboxylic transport membrane protein